jgi:hypothetical protein
LETAPRALVRQALASKLAAHELGGWRQVGLDCNRGVELDEEIVRLIPRRGEARQAGEPTSAEFVWSELRSVRGNPDETQAGLSFPITEVPGKLLLGIRALATQVPFELEDRLTKEGIGPSTHLWERALEVDFGARCAEAMHEQFVDESPHLLVPRASGKLSYDPVEALPR